MILRLIGAILLIISTITGAALTGMTLLGIEVTLDYPGWGWGTGISSIDGKLAVAFSHTSIPVQGFQGAGPSDIEVYKYRVTYTFNATRLTSPVNIPPSPAVTVTQVAPAGNTTVTVTTTIQAHMPPPLPAGGVNGYNVEECWLYIVTEKEWQTVLSSPGLYQRLQSGMSYVSQPAQFEAYLKLLESITPHIYKVQASGATCRVEAMVDSRPVYILVVHIVDPASLRVEQTITYATDTGVNTIRVAVTGEDILRFIEDPSPDSREKRVRVGGSVRVTVPVYDAIDKILSTIIYGAGSILEVKAGLEVGLMSMWRLASIVALGILLMRFDKGEQGDLLPGPLKRLARRLGAGRR